MRLDPIHHSGRFEIHSAAIVTDQNRTLTAFDPLQIKPIRNIEPFKAEQERGIVWGQGTFDPQLYLDATYPLDPRPGFDPLRFLITAAIVFVAALIIGQLLISIVGFGAFGKHG